MAHNEHLHTFGIQYLYNWIFTLKRNKDVRGNKNNTDHTNWS